VRSRALIAGCTYKTPNAVVWDFLMNVRRRGNLGSEQKQHNAQVPVCLQVLSELELNFQRLCHYSTSYWSSIRRSQTRRARFVLLKLAGS